jgi:hypothetical protein
VSLWGALAALFAKRRPSPPPKRPAQMQLTMSARDSVTGSPLSGQITLNGLVTASFDGRLTYPVTPGLFGQGLNVVVNVPGYVAQWRPVSDFVDPTVLVPFEMVALPRPAVISAGEKGPLHVDHTLFKREDGSIFPWIGCSDFALFARYARGENIGPILDERIMLGFNLLRVFGMFDRFGIGGPQASGLGEFTPANTPDYYRKLRAFVDETQSRGLRIEFVYFADADARSDGTGGLMTDRTSRQAHIDAIRAALLGTWGVNHSLSNEAFKNFEDAESYTIDPALGPRTYGTKLPDGDIPKVWKILDYLEPHDHERKEEWPRTVRGYGEIVDALKVPVVANEPIGFAEVARPGSRATDANDAAWFAAGMQMFAAGSTFHSDDGVASRLFQPVQKAAAKAWTWAARWVPPEAQLAPYQRGGAGGGAGVGDMPLEHRDLGEGVEPMALRTFAKRVGAYEHAIAIRPSSGWSAVPRDGWRVTEQPRLGFVKLTR